MLPVIRWVLTTWEKVGAAVMVLVCFVLPFFFGSWSLDQNVLLWRIFSNSNSSHHMVIIWSMGVFFLGLVYVGKFSKLLSLFSLLMVVAVHELIWWLVDWFFVGYTVVQGIVATPAAYLSGLMSGYLFPLSVIVVIFWFSFRLRAPWRLVLWVGLFYAFWAGMGFPVTVNFSGPTAQYASLDTNGLEWTSWVWAFSGFVAWEARNLTKAQLYMTTLLQGSPQ